MRFFCLIAAILCSASNAAATADAAWHTPFMGVWVSAGDTFGQPATSQIEWTDAGLDGKFVRLDYRVETRPENSKPFIFKGTAYYPSSSEGKTVKAIWADSNGNLHPVAATISDETLVALWGTEATEQGRTRYELLSPTQMEITDWVKRPEGWKQFNRNIFVRQMDKPSGH